MRKGGLGNFQKKNPVEQNVLKTELQNGGGGGHRETTGATITKDYDRNLL